VVSRQRAMNWNSRAVSEVAKERIWKEHVATERSKIRIFDQFRKNPHRVAKDKPLSDPINRRAVRFLDRESAFLETIERRVASTRHQNGATTAEAHEPAPASTLPPIDGGRRGSVGVAGNTVEQQPSPRPTVQGPGGESNGQTTKDFNFGELWSTMLATPSRKYPAPMTEAMELGWMQPETKPRDPRFTYNHRSTEMTRFARSLSRAKPPKS